MPLRTLVATALAICAVAGAITAVADKGRDEPAAASASASAKGAAVNKPAAKPQSAVQGKTVRVRMQRLAFAPRTIHLRVGDRVVWRNADSVGHNVTTQQDPAGTNLVDLHSPTIAAGATYAFVSRYPGAATYVCTIHPTTMQARIVVAKRS
jgi:plastocyanin